MAGFKFPQAITYDDRAWRLVYAPDNPETLLPNLTGSRVTSVTCDPVRAVRQDGKEQTLYVTVLNIEFPPRQDAMGNAIGGRILKGFHTSFTPPPITPLNPQTIQPDDCAFYMAEQSSGQSLSAAQRLFDAIMGQSRAEEHRARQADGAWCQELSQFQTALPEVKDGPQHTDGSPDEKC